MTRFGMYLVYSVSPVILWTSWLTVGQVVNITLTFTSHYLFLASNLDWVDLETQTNFYNPPK